MSLNLSQPRPRTSRPRYWTLLGVLGSSALVAGLITQGPTGAAVEEAAAPVAPAAAAPAEVAVVDEAPVTQSLAAKFGKPAVKLDTIGDSGSLKLTWKKVTDNLGKVVSTYVVYYGTSSSKSKASKITFTLGKDVTAPSTSPSYVLNRLKPKTTYYVWLQPIGTDGKTKGPTSDRDVKKTKGFGYIAPVEIHVANMTRTTAEVVFRTVTGVPIYRVKATAKGHKTIYACTGADGNWVIRGLDPKTKYTFTVSSALQLAGGCAQLSKESSKKATGTTSGFNPTMDFPMHTITGDSSGSLTNAPSIRDSLSDPNDGATYNGVYLTWTSPAGYNPNTQMFLFDYATDQRMTLNTGRAQWGPSTLPTNTTNTTNVVPAVVPSTTAPSTTAPATTTPSTTEPAPSATTASPEPSDSAEPSESAAPSESTTPTDSAEPTATALPSSTEGTPSGSASPSETASPSDGATTALPTESTATQSVSVAPTTTQEEVSGSPEATATQLAAITYTAKIGLPKSNWTYYLRVRVMWRQKALDGVTAIPNPGGAVGDRTEAVLVKTLSPFGYITGQLHDDAGRPLSGAVCANYVVQAFGPSTFKGGTGLDVQQQVDLVDASGACNGSFRLHVRPGAEYYVQALYVGPSNGRADGMTFRPAWYRQGTTGIASRSLGATKLSVTVGKTTALANPIRVGLGGNITGVAPCGNSTGRCTVDVVAMVKKDDGNTVTAIARSNSSGVFTLKGVPAGTYELRVTKPESGTYKHIADALVAKPNAKNWKSGVVVVGGRTVTVK